nr:zinc finger, CCHC-type [Tanacetum cinerariifolium]
MLLALLWGGWEAEEATRGECKPQDLSLTTLWRTWKLKKELGMLLALLWGGREEVHRGTDTEPLKLDSWEAEEATRGECKPQDLSLTTLWRTWKLKKELVGSFNSARNSLILGQYTQHGLKKDESISVSSIIDKLPPSWKDFKLTLKHGKDDLSLVQLGSH